MAAPTCVRCGRPTPDGYACRRPCAQSLAEDLRTAGGHAEDAEATIARQTRFGGGSRASSVEPLPVNLTASARYAAIETAVGGWARIVTEETGRAPRWRTMAGPLCPPTGVRCEHGSCAALRRTSSPPALALELAWLAMQVDVLRKHPAAKEAFDELHAACAELARIVDRPADRDLVGMCDCGKVLYADQGRQLIQCPMPTCKLVWHVERSREILRKHLDERLVTAAEAAHLGAFLDTDRSTKQIRSLVDKWGERGRLEKRGEVLIKHQHRECPDGCDVAMDRIDTYRFADIALRMAQTPTRTTRTAEMGA